VNPQVHRTCLIVEVSPDTPTFFRWPGALLVLYVL
jgi:hypothetical protein